MWGLPASRQITSGKRLFLLLRGAVCGGSCSGVRGKGKPQAQLKRTYIEIRSKCDSALLSYYINNQPLRCPSLLAGFHSYGLSHRGGAANKIVRNKGPAEFSWMKLLPAPSFPLFSGKNEVSRLQFKRKMPPVRKRSETPRQKTASSAFAALGSGDKGRRAERVGFGGKTRDDTLTLHLGPTKLPSFKDRREMNLAVAGGGKGLREVGRKGKRNTCMI